MRKGQTSLAQVCRITLDTVPGGGLVLLFAGAQEPNFNPNYRRNPFWQMGLQKYYKTETALLILS